MMKTNHMQPTFLLKNVVPSELYAKYKKGYFNRPIPAKSSIKMANPQLKTSTVCDDKVSQVEISGKENVEIFTKQGYKPLLGGRCTYRKRDFETEQIGYPIAYDHKLLLGEEAKTVHVFWTEDCFHSYECALGYLNRINQGYIKDALMVDAEVMLKYMYHVTYENAPPLLAAKDPILLIDNGGSMTFEDWSNPKILCTRTNTVIKIPAQVVYAKTFLK